MCGICGSTEDRDGRRVGVMRRLMAHRGPDDESGYTDRETGVSLGVRRLSILDVEGGRQPLTNEDGSVFAILNGEIYNHRALRDRLLERGHQLASRSDTEVLVHLYEEYGDDLVHALEGMFAFAIWDARRRRLVLARDRFGEKPLFYAEHTGGLVFASELTAVAEGARLSVELVPRQVDAFFVFGYVPGPQTLVRGIHQLPPGHLLSWTCSDRRTELRRYRSPPLSRGTAGGEPLPELVAETRRLLESSVASRLNADVPLGLLISGGIDSTLIAAIAARRSRTPLRTYTVGYDVGTVDETQTARDIATALQTEHRELILTRADVAERAPSIMRRLDQPLADQALVPYEAICELARSEVKVLIGGDGADEVFGGYPRYLWIDRADRLARVVPERIAVRGARMMGRAPLGARWQRLGDILGPGPMLERHVDWVTWRRRDLRRSVYGPRLAHVASSDVVSSLLQHSVNGSIIDTSPASELMELDQRHWLPDDVLVKSDRAGMLVSVEVRTPYLQRELTEFAASVGTDVHLSGGGKRLLRQLGVQMIPSIPQRRPKRAFRVPAAEWLREPLAPALMKQVDRGTMFSEGWFDREAVRTLVGIHISGQADHAQVLWPILAFGVWLDRLGGSLD
jgi:asparagine synthase (glutamine-hydrolysing)